MRPSKQANDLIVDVIGRAQALYPEVQLYGFVALSNHMTYLVSLPAPTLRTPRLPSLDPGGLHT